MNRRRTAAAAIAVAAIAFPLLVLGTPSGASAVDEPGVTKSGTGRFSNLAVTVSQTEQGRKITWPTTRFTVASPPGADTDIVLIRGIEPSTRWRSFCAEVLELCHSLEVNKVVLLGSLLADVPYARPLPISGSAVASPRNAVTPCAVACSSADVTRSTPTCW